MAVALAVNEGMNKELLNHAIRLNCVVNGVSLVAIGPQAASASKTMRFVKIDQPRQGSAVDLGPFVVTTIVQMPAQYSDGEEFVRNAMSGADQAMQRGDTAQAVAVLSAGYSLAVQELAPTHRLRLQLMLKMSDTARAM